MQNLTGSLRQATDRLSAAGVDSAANDARLIAAHLLGVGRMDLFRHGDDPVPEGFDEMVARRVRREPLQHILGVAPFGPLDLAVGPGVFIPRPETEVLADWAVRRVQAVPTPRVVDLCTGSGALAAYLAQARADAVVAGVEKHPAALEYARRNLPRHVRLVAGDVTDPDVLAEWQGTCDLVVANPPYVPETPDLAPEVYRDPPEAVFAGATGMDVITAMAETVHRLLRPGGAVGMEHDDTTSAAVQEIFAGHGGFGGVAPLRDLTGRARFVTASKL